MDTTETLPRIDRYTCKFENPVMEERYKLAKWMRVKRPIHIAMVFMALVLMSDTHSSYGMAGGFHPLLLIYPVFIGLFLSFLWWPERLKGRYFDLILCVLFLGYHGFQVVLMIVFPEAMETAGIDGKAMLAMTPFLLIMMNIVLPLNFLVTLVMVGVFLGSFAPMFMGITDAPKDLWLFTLVFPLVVLTYNKYRTEHVAREDFAKTVSLDEAQGLMQQTLRRYFGDVLSDKMLKEGGEIEGENRWVSISFTDIASYSTITENMSPEVALEFLNEYFTGMHEVIKRHNGHILNYIGDAVMVVFGAPDKLKNHENQALLCAIEMEEKLKELNRHWDENETSRYWKNHGIEAIGCRTGIHTGSVIAGNIGSKDMLQYTTIGDAVNVAARLEASNKEFQTAISFSHEIYTALTKDLHKRAELSGEIVLKGRTQPTKVYTVRPEVEKGSNVLSLAAPQA
jgi:class 3 adenylate cyclase